MLTGEYAVLQGASSIAIPTVKGQSLEVKLLLDSNRILEWTSFDVDGKEWFNGLFDLDKNEFTISTNESIAKTLKVILREARNNSVFLDSNSYSVVTRLDFNREFGLGSSSTLLCNIAQWANIDPFNLLDSSFGGSGYDLAVAQSNSAIKFWRSDNSPNWLKSKFNPSFKSELWFVHLNQKAISRNEIKVPFSFKEVQLERINTISEQFLSCESIEEIEKLINEHEEIVSNALNRKTVKENLFSDYPRSIKSLGAWGGDFILVTAKDNELEYFRNKGYNSIFNYSELILNNEREGR